MAPETPRGVHGNRAAMKVNIARAAISNCRGIDCAVTPKGLHDAATTWRPPHPVGVQSRVRT
jgi:hypothetical protein